MPTLIDTLITKLSFQSDTRGLVAAEKGIERITKKTNTASMAMAKFNHVLSLIGVSLGIHKLIEYGNEWDDVNNKIKSTGLSGNALSNTLDRIKTISNQTGTSLHANAELYQQLSLSMGELVGQKDLFTVMDSLNKVFAINSTSVRSSKLATVALGKALEGPTVAYREIKAAMLDVPGIAQVLNAHFKSLGTTTQEALEGNKFASKELVKILIASNQAITKQFNATKRTFPQAITALKNEMTEFFGSLRNQTGITEKLISSVERLSEKFKSWTQFLKENKDAVKAFGGAILTFLTLLIIRLGIISALMLARFVPLIAGLSVITLLIQDLYVFITGGRSAIERFLKWLGLSEQTIEKLRFGINWLIGELKWLIEKISESEIAVTLLVSALGLLGTAWAVGKAMAFARALSRITDNAFDALGATKKLNKAMGNSKGLNKTPTKIATNSATNVATGVAGGAAAGGLGKSLIRNTPTAIGWLQWSLKQLFKRVLGPAGIAYTGWEFGEWFSNTNAGKAFATPFKSFTNAVMDANPRYNPKKIQEMIEAQHDFGKIQYRLLQHSDVNNITRTVNSNADNSKYTDSSRNTININIQNANNPIDVQRAVEDALTNFKRGLNQQFRASALNHDSVIYR